MFRSVVVLLVGLVSGCTSTFHETHYFKSQVSAAAIPNYYRLTVDGFSGFNSSRYVSGYFDEDTVNTYFNEYTQPAGAGIAPSKKAESNSNAGVAAAVEPISGKLRGQKLVMILSSNSDAVASQLGALASNKQFTAALAGLLARNQYTSADAAERRLALEKSRGTATSNLAAELVGGIADGASAAEVEQKLVAFVNALAADLGYEGTFSDLDKAAQWLETNRGRLLRGER